MGMVEGCESEKYFNLKSALHFIIRESTGIDDVGEALKQIRGSDFGRVYGEIEFASEDFPQCTHKTFGLLSLRKRI